MPALIATTIDDDSGRKPSNLTVLCFVCHFLLQAEKDQLRKAARTRATQLGHVTEPRSGNLLFFPTGNSPEPEPA
jgi:hypothetical protein